VRLLVLIGLLGAVPACLANKPMPVQHMREVDYVETAPAPGEAAVIFLRLAQGPHVTSIFEVPDVGPARLVAILTPQTKFVLNAAPGPHTFMLIGGGSTAFLGATLQEGKVYGVLVAHRLEVWREFSLQPIRGSERQQFPAWLADARWVETTHESLTWAHENAADTEAQRSKHFPEWKARPDAEHLVLNAEDALR